MRYREKKAANLGSLKGFNDMNISIFGLGYVGCVSLGCLARNGHNVIGIDIQKLKVDLINSGKPTIIEKDIYGIIEEQYRKGTIRATFDYKEAVGESEISILCVGTPSTLNGHLNLEHICETARQIGEALASKKEFHIVVIRSTVLPGTNEQVGRIIEEVSGKEKNRDFAVISNPEFLREGSAVEDYYNPSVTVLAGENEYALDVITKMYEGVKAPIVRVDIKVAEIIKYVNNSFHALKVVFANEVGNICKKLDLDSHKVMKLFCMDDKLNLSSYYLKPGFAYGGSCLPKDLKTLKTLAHDHYLDSPIINAIAGSNEQQKDVALRLIESTNKKKIGILGLSFKPGTDDLRYSPIVEVVERLIGKGYEVRVYDNNVNLSRLMGKNKSYIEEILPHLSSILSTSVQDVLAWADVIVISNKEKEFHDIRPHNNQKIIDLVRIDSLMSLNNYEGICW
jgi:GDP-mannose 6-dehydrogenase